MAYTFLSKEWFEELERVRAEMGDVEVRPELDDLLVDMVVTNGPDGDVEAHLEKGVFAAGAAPDAPTHVTVPYDTALKLFIQGDQMAAMSAFMNGQIKVTGDQTKIMALQQGGLTSPSQQELQDRIRAFTAA